MRLTTIWTLRGLPLNERFSRSRDSIASSVAARLPLRVRYWATLQEVGYATRESPNIPATQLSDVLAGLRTPANLS